MLRVTSPIVEGALLRVPFLSTKNLFLPCMDNSSDIIRLKAGPIPACLDRRQLHWQEAPSTIACTFETNNFFQGAQFLYGSDWRFCTGNVPHIAPRCEQWSLGGYYYVLCTSWPLRPYPQRMRSRSSDEESLFERWRILLQESPGLIRGFN